MPEADDAGIFKLIEGLKPVDPVVLAAYEREMTEHAIPEIIRDVNRRQTRRGDN
jgi:hypothetical protein